MKTYTTKTLITGALLSLAVLFFGVAHAASESQSRIYLSNQSADSDLNALKYTKMTLNCGGKLFSVGYSGASSINASQFLGKNGTPKFCQLTATQAGKKINLATFTAIYNPYVNQLIHTSIKYNKKQVCNNSALCDPIWHSLNFIASFNMNQLHGPGCICDNTNFN